MVIQQCCCDPYKLTYISGIVTAIEAVLFGTLNIVLILMNRCIIVPPDDPPGGGFAYFWIWYFYDEGACLDQEVDPPTWIQNHTYPINPHPHTSVDSNYDYQITYLVLHGLWFISAFILIYGNARKRWGFYLPWLTVSLSLLIMDIVISAFFISDIVEVTKDGTGYRSAMFWGTAMYFRIFIFWFVNLNKFASACNAFCKSYHKRTKQDRLQKKQQKKQEREKAEAVAAAQAETRAEYEQQNQAPPPQQTQAPPPQQTQAPPPQHTQLPPQQQQPQQHFVPIVPPVQYDDPMQQSGVGNAGYEHDDPPPKKQPPPVPKKPKAPPGVRPFNYLNPTFRPENSQDIEGMRANAAYVPDTPTEILRHSRPNSMNHDELDYFPRDGYTKPGNYRSPNAPKRHDSMRNMRTQEPAIPLQRFSSTRGTPRTPYDNSRAPYGHTSNQPYAPPPDYDRSSERYEQRQPLPRVVGHSPSGRHNNYPPPAQPWSYSAM